MLQVAQTTRRRLTGMLRDGRGHAICLQIENPYEKYLRIDPLLFDI